MSLLAQTVDHVLWYLEAIVRSDQMSFGIYLAGFVILIGGLVYGAVIMDVAARWIVVGATVLLGLGILTGVKATRQKDSSGS